MNLFVLIALVAAEVALVCTTFTKWKEKPEWRKNRALVRLIETALVFCIVLLPTTHMKWRFLIALVVLIARFLIAGISWLARRKKTGTRKKLWTVVNCVFSVILIAFTLIPSFVFSNYNGIPTTGQYGVSEVSGILVDSSRKDPFESDGTDREVPVHFYYPETDSAGSNPFPLIVFSHGAFGYYQSNFSTYMELASHGYVVVALDHPHHSFFTKDTAGKTVIVDTDFINDVMAVNEEGVSNEQIFTLSQEWLQLRIADEDFALDCIERAKMRKSLDAAWHTENEETIVKILAMTDTDKIGLMGHSLGGASSVTLARQRSDIDAVIDLDGTMLGEIIGVENGKNIYNEETYKIPVLDFMKEKDYTEREQYKKENGMPYVNEFVMAHAENGKTVVFQNAGHMDFTDLPLISPTLANMLGHGNVDSEEFLITMNEIILEWFDYTLKGEGAPDIQAKY